jgi:hypothetical protein
MRAPDLLEPRFWIAYGLPTMQELIDSVKTTAYIIGAKITSSNTAALTGITQ